MRRVLIALMATSLAAGGASLAAGCSASTPTAAPAPAATTASVSGAGPRHNAADVDFARTLIPHHREGITLAAAVAARNPDARTLAEAIIVTQQDEVVRLTDWLRTWGTSAPAPGATPPATTAPPGAAPPATTAPPGATPPATTAAPGATAAPGGDPLRALIAHQDEAVKIAQREQANGANLTALDFARQIIESRTAQTTELTAYAGRSRAGG